MNASALRVFRDVSYFVYIKKRNNNQTVALFYLFYVVSNIKVRMPRNKKKTIPMKVVNVIQIDDERSSLEDDTDFIEASEPLWIPFSN